MVGILNSDLATPSSSPHATVAGRLKNMRESLLSEASTSGFNQPSLKITVGWSESSGGCRDHDRVSRLDSSSAASLSSGGAVEDTTSDAFQEPHFTPASSSEHLPSAQVAQPLHPDPGDKERHLSINIISATDSYLALEHCDVEGLEPDLIIVLGPAFRLRGYPPHHARLSELVHCPGNREGTSFDKAVDKFMCTEQRFGR